MTPARFQTIEEIFLAALDQEPDQVSAFLDTACEGDAVLRREVEALLASDQRAGRFIERSVLVSRPRLFKMGKLIRSSVRRSATTKFLNRSAPAGWAKSIWPPTSQRAAKPRSNSCPLRFTGDAERLKRFQQEAHAVVALNHPNILTVYEIGEDHSIHYIASELIEGETLRQRLTRGPNAVE